MRSKLMVATLCLFVGGATARAQEKPSSISAPVQREKALSALADALTMPAKPDRRAGKGLKDPFNPPAADLVDVAQAAAAEVQAMSDRQLLETLSAKIQPSGSVTLNGEPYLLFTEKRLKIGEFITVMHEGVEYKLEILSIENNRFRMRYRAEEILRPIK